MAIPDNLQIIVFFSGLRTVSFLKLPGKHIFKQATTNSRTFHTPNHYFYNQHSNQDNKVIFHVIFYWNFSRLYFIHMNKTFIVPFCCFHSVARHTIPFNPYRVFGFINSIKFFNIVFYNENFFYWKRLTDIIARLCVLVQ